MNDTPRTDSFLTEHNCGKRPVDVFGDDWSHYDIESLVDHARQLERELNEARLQLSIEQATEKCSQCGHSFSPSWVESGWCILCILKERKKEHDQWRKCAEGFREVVHCWLHEDDHCGITIAAQQALDYFNELKGKQ